MILHPTFENKIIDSIIRGQALSLGFSAFHIGLVRLNGSEVTSPSYSRVQINRSLTHWEGTQGGGETTISDGDSGETSNIVTIEFPEALEDWGSVNKIRLYTASSGTNYFADIAIEPMNILTGQQITFNPGDLTISIRGE